MKPQKCAIVPVLPDWGRFNAVSAATHLGFVMGSEGVSPVAKWSGRVAHIRASGTQRSTPHRCSPGPPGMWPRSFSRRGVWRTPRGTLWEVRLPGNMLGQRWHGELVGAGGGQFGNALAHVTACRIRAASTNVLARWRQRFFDR